LLKAIEIINHELLFCRNRSFHGLPQRK
jgi:hypothetical protein